MKVHLLEKQWSHIWGRKLSQRCFLFLLFILIYTHVWFDSTFFYQQPPATKCLSTLYIFPNVAWLCFYVASLNPSLCEILSFIIYTQRPPARPHTHTHTLQISQWPLTPHFVQSPSLLHVCLWNTFTHLHTSVELFSPRYWVCYRDVHPANSTSNSAFSFHRVTSSCFQVNVRHKPDFELDS